MATIDELNKKLDTRIKLRCKGKQCSMRSGFFIWERQREYYLNKKCLLCDSGLTQLNITEEKGG